MASKQVTDRQKAGSAVAAVVDTNEALLRKGVAAAVADLEDEDEDEAADVAVAVAHMAKVRLVHAMSELVDADAAYAVELMDDDGLRTSRDGLATDLRGLLVPLREGLATMYGDAVPGSVGFEGRTPEDPVVLVRFANDVVAGLRKVKLPPSRYKRAKIDPLEEALPIEELAGRLQASIDDVTEDVRQNEQTKLARDRALNDFDRTFSRSANLLTALFDFAGEPVLADRVRPSTRKAGRLAQSDGEPEEEPEGAPETTKESDAAKEPEAKA